MIGRRRNLKKHSRSRYLSIQTSLGTLPDVVTWFHRMPQHTQIHMDRHDIPFYIFAIELRFILIFFPPFLPYLGRVRSKPGIGLRKAEGLARRQVGPPARGTALSSLIGR